MADRETWAKRVAEWRSSGLSSPVYCAGKDFTAGGLRHWAHRLSHGEQRRPAVRVARIVRVERARQDGRPSPAGEVAPDLVVEIGGARIAVRAGFDRATLAAVLEEVLATAGRSTR
jgi:hypothetical protein